MRGLDAAGDAASAAAGAAHHLRSAYVVACSKHDLCMVAAVIACLLQSAFSWTGQWASRPSKALTSCC